jgi:hypothetical protein
MKKLFLTISLLFFTFIIYTNVYAFTCSIVDEFGNTITEAKAGDLVYLKNSYVNLKSGKMTWTLKANLPTINSKNYKMLINNSGYYYHDGSAQENNNFIPVAIPAFDYIKGTSTIIYSLSKGRKCSIPLYISEYVEPTIMATAGPNGSITPSGTVTVTHWQNQTFTITPDTDYDIADVVVDGASVGAVSSYTFTKITSDHTINATFATTQQSTGIHIQAVTINSDAGPDFDVYSAPLACPVDNPTGPEVLLHREDAVISITSAKLNPNSDFDPFPASVEQCTITYKKAKEDPSAPVIESWTQYPNCTLDGTGTNSCPVSIIDITRKQQYWNGIADGIHLPAEYPTHYIASYRCKYMNLVGKSGYFSVEYDLWLADFLICG